MNPVTYLNNSVWCKIAPSNIHGIGVFAIRDIQKGVQITDYTYYNIIEKVPVIELEPKMLRKILPPIRKLILDRMLFDASQKTFRFVSPNHDQVLQSFMNHSDTPNSDGLYALRDIKEGEEITENFHTLVKKPHRITKNHCSVIWNSMNGKT